VKVLSFGISFSTGFGVFGGLLMLFYTQSEFGLAS
jgi:hypothetical protein